MADNPMRRAGVHARKPYAHRHKGAGGKPQTESSSDLKKSIRDAERTLRRPNVNADQRQELERRVKALRLKLAQTDQTKKEQKLYEKYKYVRFVERKKVLRKIAQTRRQLAEIDNPNTKQGHDHKDGSINSDGDDQDCDEDGDNLHKDETPDDRRRRLQETLETLQLQLAYVDHFPTDTKYVALFPNAPEPENALSAILRSEIMIKVKNALDQGLFERRGFVLRMGNPVAASVATSANAMDINANLDGDSKIGKAKHLAQSEDSNRTDADQEKSGQLTSKKRKHVSDKHQDSGSLKDQDTNAKHTQKKPNQTKKIAKSTEPDDFFA